MKKLIAILLGVLLVTLGAMATAENPFDDLFGGLPVDPGSDTPPRSDIDADSSITIEVNGESVRLAYDASPQYSSIHGGNVQASYYAYGADDKTLYELYITFPETARPGMVITPEYALLTNEESSVVLIVSRDSEETYYFSSQLDGRVYPSGSGFTISIDSIDETSGTVSYAGTLSASLVALDMASGEVSATLDIPATPFRFTLSGQLSSPVPDEPRVTPVPEDLRRV